MSKVIKNISKGLLIIGGIVGTVVVTTLFSSTLSNKDEYKDILMVDGQR